MSMRVTVEVTQEDLVEMDVTPEQLEEAVRNELGSLDVEGDSLYINDLDVTVVVSDNCSKENRNHGRTEQTT